MIEVSVALRERGGCPHAMVWLINISVALQWGEGGSDLPSFTAAVMRSSRNQLPFFFLSTSSLKWSRVILKQLAVVDIKKLSHNGK